MNIDIHIIINMNRPQVLLATLWQDFPLDNAIGSPKQPDICQKNIKATNQKICSIISPKAIAIALAYILQYIALPLLPTLLKGWPILPRGLAA